MTREELRRELNIKVHWWEESDYVEAMKLLDKYLDEYEKQFKKDKK